MRRFLGVNLIFVSECVIHSLYIRASGRSFRACRSWGVSPVGSERVMEGQVGGVKPAARRGCGCGVAEVVVAGYVGVGIAEVEGLASL